MKNHFACVALLFLSGSQLMSQSAGPSFEFERLSLQTSGRAGMPAPIRGADGVTRMSWVERGEDGLAILMLATLGDQGFTQPLEIARGTDWFVNWADFPTSAALGDGTLFTAWMRKMGSGTYAYGIEFSLSRDEGITWSEPQWLHSDRSPSEHGFLSVVALDDAHFLAVWLDGRETASAQKNDAEHEGSVSHATGAHGVGGAQQLWSRTIGRDGALGEEQRVDDRVCDCCGTSLVRRSDGTVVAAWRDRSEAEVRDIHWASFTGEQWTVPKPLHNDGWVLPGCPVNGPRLAAADDRLACIWHTGADPPGTFVAHLGSDRQGSSTNGKASRFGSVRALDNGTSAGRVDCTYLEDGSLLLTWMERGAESFVWRAQGIGPTGVVGFPQDIATTTSDRSSGFLRVAPFKGGALIAWTDPEERTILAARLRIR